MNNEFHDALVLVVLPSHNSERFFATAIGSVRKQTYRILEPIAVDDSSTDLTATLLDGGRRPAYACNDARVT